MNNISKFIETRLKLVVNLEKSQVAKSDRVKFFGLTIVDGAVAISRKALQTAMDKVKELTPRLWKEKFADNPLRSLLHT